MTRARTQPGTASRVVALGALVGLLASCTVRSEAALCRVLANEPAGRTEREWAAYLETARAVAPGEIADDFGVAAEATRRTMNPRIDDAVLVGGRMPDDILDSLTRVEDYAFDRCGIDLFNEPSGPVGGRGNRIAVARSSSRGRSSIMDPALCDG